MEPVSTSRGLRTTLVGLALAGVSAVSLSSAMATPGSVPGATPSDSVSGSLASTSIQQDKVKLQSKQATTVTTFDLTYPPGAFSGWHSHPGIVIAVVKQGSVERQTACTTETFTVGQAFTEVGPHYVSNTSSTEPAVLSITRIYPSSATVARIDEPAPKC